MYESLRGGRRYVGQGVPGALVYVLFEKGRLGVDLLTYFVVVVVFRGRE